MREPVANKEYVQSVLSAYSTKALKKYGQNFLINDSLAQSIVNSLDVDEKTTIVEIGPGLGALSYHLKQKDNEVFLVEIDKLMCEHLDRIIKKENVHIINNDVLKVDIDGLGEEIVIIGNLPYYITSDIIEKILRLKNIKQATLMVQKEAYERLKAKQGSKDYSPLSIFLDYKGETKILNKVSRHNYIPEPHVDSLIFKLCIKEKRDKINEELLIKVLKAMFLMRRKTILNNLSQFLKNKEKAEKILRSLQCDCNARPEQLDLKFYLDLTNILSKA